MDLQLNEFKKLKGRIFKQLHKKGYGQDAEDAAHDYIVRIIEARNRFQSIEFFCADFIRKHYTGRKNCKRASRKKYAETIRARGAKIFDGSEVENKTDYNKIMDKIIAIENPLHRRIMIMFFVSGLNGVDISRREKMPLSSVYAIINNYVKIIRQMLRNKRTITK